MLQCDQNRVGIWQNVYSMSTASTDCLQQLFSKSVNSRPKIECCRVANQLLISCPCSGVAPLQRSHRSAVRSWDGDLVTTLTGVNRVPLARDMCMPFAVSGLATSLRAVAPRLCDSSAREHHVILAAASCFSLYDR